ncbi:MAG: lysine exporter LysO family protein [Aliivibrio sp.]|uniref:lysine exporter LysO family protein n=1 Tax=Aliivibrio sp. TaxID=1872443 RepID=UPI001A4E158D|nr:lysine exporter LysO family protein [Aliivibrio sp.]
MLYIFLPLVFGYLIPISNDDTLKRINSHTNRLILVILSLMGLSLAGLDNLNQNLSQILKYTLVFFTSIGFFNLAVLPLIDRFLPIKSENKKNKVPLTTMALESLKLIVVVALGLVVGLVINIDLSWVDTASEIILLLLLFLIGIQLRNSGLTLKQILVNKQGLSIAAAVIVSSLMGGVIAALILDIPINYGLAMASGFGWYSLAGILMGDALGPVYGGASFMLELLRELVALMLIPMIIQRHPSTAIGYAGATAMDFTLPIIQNTGGIKCVPIAIVSGFILSLLVPILMLFFVSL